MENNKKEFLSASLGRGIMFDIPVLSGGMGVWISTWRLARSVALIGGGGIVSGTALYIIIARLLQLGDPGGHLKRAFDAFPFQNIAKRVYEKYFIRNGKKEDEKFRDPGMFSLDPDRELIELTVIANFAEVFLAKEGHSGMIGVNYLEKIQMPHIYSLFGAILAGVDFVTVGAGIPSQFPLIIDGLSRGESVKYHLDVTGAKAGSFCMHFNPKDFFSPHVIPELSKPSFMPIISSTVLAKRLTRELPGEIAAFIVESPTAGGHNAPPRDKNSFNQRGEPVYGPKDEVDLSAIKELGIPHILAGGYSDPEKANQAFADNALAIQAGTIFQFSEDSGLTQGLRAIAKRMAFRKELDVLTSNISPTGYPFKIACIPGTLADQTVYKARPRVCDLGLLRELYLKEDGSLGYRCSAEPLDSYLRKGGKRESCQKDVCLCNTLMANVGLAQRRAKGYVEPPLITSGDDVSFVQALMKTETDSYCAEDAVKHILRKTRYHS